MKACAAAKPCELIQPASFVADSSFVSHQSTDESTKQRRETSPICTVSEVFSRELDDAESKCFQLTRNILILRQESSSAATSVGADLSWPRELQSLTEHSASVGWVARVSVT